MKRYCVMAVVIGCGLLASCITFDAYDAQGRHIVETVYSGDIPVDGMSGGPGIYSEAWTYFDIYHTVQGSRIVIYGLKDPVKQDKILARINELRTTQVLVDFYDVSRFEKRTHADGSTAKFRLATPLVREVVLK